LGLSRGANMLLKPFVGRIIVFSLLTSMYGLAVNFTGVGHTGTCRPLIMGIIFIAAAMVDMETYILPDAFTIGGAILGAFATGNRLPPIGYRRHSWGCYHRFYRPS
jgi:prepilin signal peptidase PulO-like enzyme (type II secretory pathway)